MAKTSYFFSFIRQNPRILQNSNAQIRNLTIETLEPNNDSKELKLKLNHEISDQHEDFAEVAKEVCRVIRSKLRWEQTILSDFPSLNFYDPLFFHEFLKHQNNAVLSLRFFLWLNSHSNFLPDRSCCNKLFDALLEAKACNAAKLFLDYSGFSPEPSSLERYLRCLCEVGRVEETIDMFDKLKGVDFCPSIETWNLALLGCLKVNRTDLIWKLYQDMIESNVLVNVNVETVGYLIQAFCNDKKVSEAYELLQQVLEDGLAPDNFSFNKLVSGFFEEKNYTRVSELLHIMIAKNRAPDIFTYQEVINGLCKNGKELEGFQVFNNLKEKGYAPDLVMYTTMIHGLCKMGWLGEARKLWFEIIEKGYVPNEYTYNTMIYGFCKIGDFEEAKKLYKEMCDRGYKESTVCYNTMVGGLCLHGRTNEARDLFREMHDKGVVCDVVTYNSLIQGFCKEGKIVESINLFQELIDNGLEPTISTYTALIEKLCETEGVEEAKQLWNDMKNRGLEPVVCTRDHIICGLCEQGFVSEGMEWLITMLKSKLKPERKTFERLVQCLSQSDRVDDSLVVLGYMFSIGYKLKEQLCHSLVIKLCNNSRSVGTHLEEILERN